MSEELEKWISAAPKGIAAVVLSEHGHQLVLPSDFETSDLSGALATKALCAALTVSDRFASLRAHLMDVIDLLGKEPGSASA